MDVIYLIMLLEIINHRQDIPVCYFMKIIIKQFYKKII